MVPSLRQSEERLADAFEQGEGENQFQVGCRIGPGDRDTVAATSRACVLVGPLSRCSLEDISGPRIPWTNEVYSPYCGGTPATMAYAMDCGISMAVTVSPEITSARHLRQV